MNWAARVIDVHTYRREPEIRSMFSKCGEIVAVYPWNTGRTDKNHFFIEYTHEAAADRARTDYNLPDVQVHSLKLNKGMQERFQALSTGKEYRPIIQTSTRQSSEANWSSSWLNRSKSNSVDSQSRFGHNILMPTPQAEPYQYRSHSREDVDSFRSRDISLSYTSDSPRNNIPVRKNIKGRDLSMSSVNSSLSSSDETHLRSPITVREDRREIKTFKDTSSINTDSSSTSFDFKSSISPAAKSSVIRMPLTNISLVFSSEVINCDLDKFVNDPPSLIALLKETGTGRENWIMVAAYYRRKSLYESALQVALALHDVMIAEGRQEQDLRPVFLIVSQCHYDIAKQLKKFHGPDSQQAAEHVEHSVKWLQKLYGNSVLKAAVRLDGARFAASPDLMSEEPMSPQISTVLQSKHVKDSLIGNTPLLNAPKTPSAMRIHILENEIISLRNREERHLAALESAHTMKRNMEEDISEERSKRRKLEKKLDGIEIDLEKVKKLNDFAYEQLKREVESRRKAEDELEKVKRWTLEQEMSTKQQAFKSTLSDLATIFEAAACSPVAISVNLALKQALVHSEPASPSLETK